MFCNHCGNQIADNAVVCVKCGCSVNNAAAKNFDKGSVAKPDKAEAGLIVLSVIIPIVGIVLWAVKHGDTPKAAKTYGIAALITMGVSIILSIIFSFAIAEMMYYLY